MKGVVGVKTLRMLFRCHSQLNAVLEALQSRHQIQISFAFAQAENFGAGFALDVTTPVVFALAPFHHFHCEVFCPSSTAHGITVSRAVSGDVTQSERKQKRMADYIVTNWSFVELTA